MAKPITRRQGRGRPERATGLGGVRRAEHFAAGLTVAQWRGRSARFPDRRAQASRKACRGAHRKADR